MKTIAVIAELNPCHTGHVHLLSEARRLSAADACVLILSGDYVQRGEPAIFDKYVRTRMALHSGADLVLELPVAAATGSAQRFADGAVAMLQALGAVDELWFGSEAGHIDPFLEAADLLADEPEVYRAGLKEALEVGLPFPAARARALDRTGLLSPQARALTDTPNNTLGLEYVLALRRCGSAILPRTIPRIGAGHDELSSPSSDMRTVSATALRRALLSGKHYPDLAGIPPLPDLFYSHWHEALSAPLSAEDFAPMLRYALWRGDAERFASCLDVPHDLARRIEKLRPCCDGWASFAQTLKTRERTLAQIRRALLHILLGITGEDLARALAPTQLRLLGHGGNAALFHACKKGMEKGRISFSFGGAALSDPFYKTDRFASDLYESVRASKSGTPFVSEFSRPLMKVQP